MMERRPGAREETDGGFSLLELLSVAAVIGILAAVAVGVFASFRARAVDRSMVADLTSVAFAEESHHLRTGHYLSTGDVAAESALEQRLSPGNRARVELRPGGRADTFCVVVERAATVAPGEHERRIYISDRGGVAAPDVDDCR